MREDTGDGDDASGASTFEDTGHLSTILEGDSESCEAGVGHCGCSSGSSIGVVGGLLFRAFGICGSSIEGTDDRDR